MSAASSAHNSIGQNRDFKVVSFNADVPYIGGSCSGRPLYQKKLEIFLKRTE